MRLYFLRHATAEDHCPGMGDSARRLTDVGREEARGVAAGLKALGVEVDVVLTSPYARAYQTAEIVADRMGWSDRLREDARLSSGAEFGDFLAAIADSRGEHGVLVVGHEPDLSQAVGQLTGGRVRMRKASLACVSCPRPAPGAGELRWLVEPEQLARIGAG